MNDVDNCFVKNMVDSDRYQKEIKKLKRLNKSHCFVLWFVLWNIPSQACDLDACFSTDGMFGELPETQKVGGSMSLGHTWRYVITLPDSVPDSQTAGS